MDYMSGLLSTKNGNDCVFIVVDRFSNMVVLAPYKKSIINKAIANLLFKCDWFHFGLPPTIISDRDSRFLSNFLSRLWLMIDTKLTKSIAFHAHNDGKTKVVNMMIFHILRMYSSKNPHTWDEILPYVQHRYNRSLHKFIGHKIFQVCLGFQSLAPIDVALPIADTLEESSHAQTWAYQAAKFVERIQQEVPRSTLGTTQVSGGR
jgi:hypothetical protein